ncbi:HAD family hydrolase [Catenovulum agarivorans DS-2]|uniref:HAD family hydrolase n=1 Tax=Catenovulum agarivorans DS-2 TaxID=1328313 RepID=W7QRK7_9ALTE|nr:beta-phosphoglucomutase family hydrolase [Catenovulum agarivorans]EWH11612.1 HAD family hydrolase [Catenovulum agarivorans DS-2]
MNNCYQAYQAIIFDMDGTLVDSGQLHQHAWIDTLNKYAIPIEPALMRSLAGVPTKETIEILVKHFNVELTATSAEINDYKEQIVRQTMLDYVKPTQLAELAIANKGKRPMAVGTGAYTEEAKMILQACGLFELIDFVVGADQVANPKPAPDTFLHCAKLMAIAPQHCIVFEDAQTGMQAARDAGMDVVDVLETFNIKNDYFLE